MLTPAETLPVVFLSILFSVRQLLEYFLNRRAVFAAPSNTVF